MAPSASSASATPSPPGPHSKVVMHRACDECRARKIACSKDPEGCSRCAREGVRCVYSPQKRMGRPKKRRHIELNQLDGSLQQRILEEPVDDGFPQLQTSSAAHTSAFGKPAPAYNPLDMMPTLDLPFFMVPQSQVLTDPFLDMDISLFQSAESGYLDLDGTSDSRPPEAPLTRGSVHRIFETIGAFIFSNSRTTGEDCSKPPEASSPTGLETKNHSMAFPNAVCPCLSSIYLALDSLANISDNLPIAINVARKASKTAHDVIQCPVCSLPLTEDPLATPPFQSQQNMFLLSALLSSLGNAYTRLLELVDTTTAESRSESRHIHFSFRELGGAWAEVPISDGGACMLSRGIDETDLPPELWRLAMRAVIRYEVYGLCTSPDDPLCTGDNDESGHLGLARAVRRLEERSVTRHETLDKLYEEGAEMPTGMPFVPMKGAKDGEKPQCLRVIECARLALDRLVIA